MVLLLTTANERSCTNHYKGISQNLEREKSEKGKRLNLAKGGTLYPPWACLILTRQWPIPKNTELVIVAINKDYENFKAKTEKKIK